ncbi:hypothetical protein H4R35_004500 [Dimargaris xerosporica]|nr:hypothetical protein H4R35_004500 [Dimargaris xerosporica]
MPRTLREIQHWHELLEALWGGNPAYRPPPESELALPTDSHYLTPQVGQQLLSDTVKKLDALHGLLQPPSQPLQPAPIIVLDSDDEEPACAGTSPLRTFQGTKLGAAAQFVTDVDFSRRIPSDPLESHTDQLLAQLNHDFLNFAQQLPSPGEDLPPPIDLAMEDRPSRSPAHGHQRQVAEVSALVQRYHQRYPRTTLLLRLLAAICRCPVELIQTYWPAQPSTTSNSPVWHAGDGCNHDLTLVTIKYRQALSTSTAAMASVEDALINSVLPELDQLLAPMDTNIHLPPTDERWLTLWTDGNEPEAITSESEDELLPARPAKRSRLRHVPSQSLTRDRRADHPPFAVVNSIDDAVLPRLHYIKTSMVHPRIPIPSYEAIVGCDCGNVCDPSTCACAREMAKFPYVQGRLAITDPIKHSEVTLVECNDACSCAVSARNHHTQQATPSHFIETLNKKGVQARETTKSLRSTSNRVPGLRRSASAMAKGSSFTICPNRVIQDSQPFPGLEVFRTASRGWGVRTTISIPKGQFIAEYVGEIIDWSINALREPLYHELGLMYIYQLDRGYTTPLDHTNNPNMLYVDSTYYCNITRFLNHSCEGNLIMVPFVSEYHDMAWHRIAFFAQRPIVAGEELTFDYQCAEGSWVCLCASQRCRYRNPTTLN